MLIYNENQKELFNYNGIQKFIKLIMKNNSLRD